VTTPTTAVGLPLESTARTPTRSGLRYRWALLIQNIGWFARCVQPRLFAIDLVVRLIPDWFAYEVRAWLYRSAGCKLGDHVQICGRLTLYGTVWNKAGNLTIGAGSSVAPFCTFGVDGAISLGVNVGLAPYVRIFTTQHAIGPATHRSSDTILVKPVTIGDGAAVMTGATILPGITIGRGAVVGAGAVVTRDVEPNTFVGGVPAKVIATLPDGAVGESPIPHLEPSRARAGPAGRDGWPS
jgi:maltose O-acetyltransferase